MRNELLHISKIQQPNVAADIVGHEQVGQDFTPSQVRGSALYYDLNEAPPSTSGFGLFKDKVGNKIVALDMNRPQSQAIIQKGLLGTELREFTTQAGGFEWLSGGRSYTAPIICVRYGEPNFRRYEGMRANFLSDAAYKSYQQFVRVTGNEIANINDMTTNGRFDWFKLLQQIEAKRIKFSHPIVIYAMRRQKPFTFADFIEASFEVIAVVSQIASVAGIPIPPKIIEHIKTATQVLEGVYVAANNGINLKDMSDLGNLLPIAEALAPKWTKGAMAKFEKYRDQAGELRERINFGEYINRSKSMVEGFLSGATIQGKLEQTIYKQTGLDRNQVNRFIDRYNYNNITVPLDLRQIKGSITTANKVLRNAANQMTTDKLSKELKAGSIIKEIGNRQSMFSIPVLNDMFLSGNAGGILRALPDCSRLVETVINEQSKGLLNPLTSNVSNQAESHFSLIASYFGHKAPQEAFDTFTLESLYYRAFKHVEKKVPLVLPDSIPPSRKAEFKQKVEQATGADVRYTEDGWDLSPTSMNLIKVGGAALFGWGGYKAYKYWKGKNGTKKEIRASSKRVMDSNI